MAAINFERGFNRIFWCLTLGWAFSCAVLFPLKIQWSGQMRAISQHDKDLRMCQQLMAESPKWDMTKGCYQRIDQNERNTLAFYSLKKFWIWDVAFWRLELPAAIFLRARRAASMDPQRLHGCQRSWIQVAIIHNGRRTRVPHPHRPDVGQLGGMETSNRKPGNQNEPRAPLPLSPRFWATEWVVRSQRFLSRAAPPNRSNRADSTPLPRQIHPTNLASFPPQPAILKIGKKYAKRSAAADLFLFRSLDAHPSSSSSSSSPLAARRRRAARRRAGRWQPEAGGSPCCRGRQSRCQIGKQAQHA